MDNDTARVPNTCTLPTVQRPTRIAEFDALLTSSVRGRHRPAQTRLRLALDPAVESLARDLAARESQCCAFFTFTFTTTGDELYLDIDVPSAQIAVLDALDAMTVATRGHRTPLTLI